MERSRLRLRERMERGIYSAARIQVLNSANGSGRPFPDITATRIIIDNQRTILKNRRWGNPMSFAFRASLLLFAFSLNLVNSAPAQSQASPSDSKSPTLIAGSLQSSDEETLRALTEKYGLALVAGDLEMIRQFWDPQSPNLASQLKAYQAVFSSRRIEFVSMKVTR